MSLTRLGLPALLALGLVGCASTGPTSSPGGDDRLDIVAAAYPFGYVAERVAGDRATVTSLTEPGAEPHDVELTAMQVAQVSRADLVVYERSFQAAVDEAVDQSENPRVLDTTSVVPLQPLAEGEHEEHDGHVEGDEHEAEHHDHGGLDPHVWLDPTNLVTIAEAVRERLAAADPGHAADYERNAATFAAELGALDTAYAGGLKTCARREFVTTHAAFGYLARRYQLTQIGISGLSPDTEPSPARIAAVQGIAREHQITTIFSETLVSTAVSESIAGDLGLVTDVLDPVEGITPESRGTDYLAVMRANLDALRTAGGCS